MITVHGRRLAALAAIVCLTGWGATAHADWAACLPKPTRACLLEEALRGGDGAPLAGKDRLDFLVLAGAVGHPAYATAADVDEAVRQVKSAATGFNPGYISIAIGGLVAEHRTQQACDLVASLPLRAGVYLAFSELTRALAQVGDLETTAALLKRMPPLEQFSSETLSHRRVLMSVQTLAGAGKIEEALPLMTSALAEIPHWRSDVAQMAMAMATAYARRGDTRTAEHYFDLAGQDLKRELGAPYPSAVEEARISLISLSALRGDVAAVKTALQQIRAEGPPVYGLADYRVQVYPRVVASLVGGKQFPLALEVAESAPESIRDMALAIAIAGNAFNGRIDDARAALTSFGDKMDPRRRVDTIRNVAVAMVKAGKLAPAIEMAEQVTDRTGRKAILFAIAQELPQ